MKNKYLKQEIKALLSNAEKVLGKDSIQYKKLDFYLDTLVTVYEFNYDSEKDLLRELKAFLQNCQNKYLNFHLSSLKKNIQA